MDKGTVCSYYDPSSLEKYSSFAEKYTSFVPTALSTPLFDSIFHVAFDEKEVSKLLWHYRFRHLSIPCFTKVEKYKLLNKIAC